MPTPPNEVDEKLREILTDHGVTSYTQNSAVIILKALITKQNQAYRADKLKPKNPANDEVSECRNNSTKVDEAILAYYWGKPWSETGVYPDWSRYNEEQKAEVLELQALVSAYHAAGLRELKKYQIDGWVGDIPNGSQHIEPVIQVKMLEVAIAKEEAK